MEKKPGYKTSEFWVTFATSIAAIFNQSGIFGEYQLPIEAVVTLAGLVATYVISRTVIKSSEAKAEAGVISAQTNAAQTQQVTGSDGSGI